ncbi:hypothetical protein [Vulcanococcus sp.]|uniref:hypothetical protein n=1 Tax=Vulcanococcus sp. TaxID=2856995 RepID=UPI003C127926
MNTATPPTPAPGRPLWRRKRWLTIGVPIGVFAFLVAIAPPLPERELRDEQLGGGASGELFRYRPDSEVYAFDVDPRKIRLDLLEGWDREQDAYRDSAALAYFSGPMYERHVNARGQEITVPLGDLKLGTQVWRGRNRTAARQRAFVGIRHNGQVDFGYGELTPQRASDYDTFIGGLHSLYNDLEDPPAEYRGAYSVSMGQQIRYYLPRIRMVLGLRRDGRLEVLMSRDGLTLEQTKSLARQRGLKAAYLPDHASKSRFIIPGVKGFSEADANWISGGATSFVHVPYLLRLSERALPLRGDLLASLAPRTGRRHCSNPLQCGQTLGTQLVDRALAGLNRLMEQGVEPIARLIWSPKGTGSGPSRPKGQPLREPPITADPLALRELQETDGASPSEELLPLAPDLPPPLQLNEGQELPLDPDLELTSPVLGNSSPEDGGTAAPPPPLLPPPPVLAPPPPP